MMAITTTSNKIGKMITTSGENMEYHIKKVVSFLLSVAKDLPNHGTDMVLLYKEALYISRVGLYLYIPKSICP